MTTFLDSCFVKLFFLSLETPESSRIDISNHNVDDESLFQRDTREIKSGTNFKRKYKGNNIDRKQNKKRSKIKQSKSKQKKRQQRYNGGESKIKFRKHSKRLGWVKRNRDKTRAKNGNKRKKRRTKKRQNKCTERSSVNGTCLTSAVFYTNMVATVVANFVKQSKRMEKQSKTGGNKAAKKGLFKPIVDRLIQAGGENKSRMTCAGMEGTPGALQMANLTSKFEECETQINISCNPANFPQPNKSRLEDCSTATKALTTAVLACSKEKNNTEMCNCWMEAELEKTSKDVKTCSFKDEADAIAKQLKSCKTAFSVCRKYEDDAIKSMSACSKSTEKLKQTAKQLGENKAALENAQVKVGTLTSKKENKIYRQISSCSSVLKMVTQLIVMANQNPASPRVKVISMEVISVNEVKCSEDEMTQLKESKEGLKASVELVDIAYQTTVDEIKSKNIYLNKLKFQ